MSGARRREQFRENEVLRAFAEGLPGPFELPCECADPGCRELLLVEAGDVYAVRANPRRLVMAIGHETDRERIVLKHDSYVIVELEEQARS